MTPKTLQQRKREAPSVRLALEKTALAPVFDSPGEWTLSDSNGRTCRLLVLSTRPFRFRRIEPRLVPHAEAARGA
jgi:hypothetical protein